MKKYLYIMVLVVPCLLQAAVRGAVNQAESGPIKQQSVAGSSSQPVPIYDPSAGDIFKTGGYGPRPMMAPPVLVETSSGPIFVSPGIVSSQSAPQ